MVRLILFDIDGTLIHTRGAGVKAFDKTFAGEFKVNDSVQGVQFAGRTDSSIVREIFARHQIAMTPENFQRFCDCYVFWLDYLLFKGNGGICPGVWNALHVISRLPEPPTIGLLTGNIRLGAEIKLRHFQIWDSFEVGFFGDDHENRNELAVLAQKRCTDLLKHPLKGEEILVVGDTPFDVQCGQKIHAKTLAVATGPFTVEQLAACQPTWVEPDLNSVDLAQICRA